MENTISKKEFTAQELADKMNLEIVYDTGKAKCIIWKHCASHKRKLL